MGSGLNKEVSRGGDGGGDGLREQRGSEHRGEIAFTRRNFGGIMMSKGGGGMRNPLRAVPNGLHHGEDAGENVNSQCRHEGKGADEVDNLSFVNVEEENKPAHFLYDGRREEASCC